MAASDEEGSDLGPPKDLGKLDKDDPDQVEVEEFITASVVQFVAAQETGQAK